MRRCSGAEAGISAELSTFGPLKPLKFHMPRTITLTLSPKQAADRKVYTEIAARRAGVPPADVALVRILKRSVDARGRSVRVNLTLELYADGDGPLRRSASTIRTCRMPRRSSSWAEALPASSVRCGSSNRDTGPSSSNGAGRCRYAAATWQN